MQPLRMLHLPHAAPARVLACGAWLKNTAALLDGARLHLSPLHGDLSDPEACAALERSVAALLQVADGRIDAVAHDLHPDFHSTRVALRMAAELGVPAIAVQHHHAHIAVLQAEHGLRDETLIGLALDGVGLGHDGRAWGGEVLRVQGADCARVAHLPALTMPGGDVAAREPWRLVAAALHALGRGDEIVSRLGPQVGSSAARVVQTMLARDLNCPGSSAAGRWFDFAAGALGLSLRQGREAEAAQALERCATDWLRDHAALPVERRTLNLWQLATRLLDTPPAGVGAAAAAFHCELADGLVSEALQAAVRSGSDSVALGGGCFHNRLLTARIVQGLQAAGLRVLKPLSVDCGDAGLPLGQAWAAALQIAQEPAPLREIELET